MSDFVVTQLSRIMGVQEVLGRVCRYSRIGSEPHELLEVFNFFSAKKNRLRSD